MDAQAISLTFNDIGSGIVVGFCFMISSNLSKFMAQKNTKQVKRLAYISCVMLLAIGTTIGMLVYVYCDGLAALMSKNEKVQMHFVKIMKIWVFLLPCNMLSHVLQAFYKAIG